MTSRTVGLLTAQLMLPWDNWVHRRVERVTFTDQDVIQRAVSIDFTLPYWFHERRGTPLHGNDRQLVPLSLPGERARLSIFPSVTRPIDHYLCLLHLRICR